MSDLFRPDAVIGGRYRVLRKLGGGGMADVYLCDDLTLGRRVAIKVLLQRYVGDPSFVERFRREAQAAAALNHPGLVSIYDWGQVDGTYYIVMEYVEGETLKDAIRRRGRIPADEAVGIALQLLAAVDYAHRHGIIHRDIKPHNVMLSREGGVKVMDFGIARVGDSGMTEAGSVLGTAQYIAPEQAQGRPVDERSDLYSVGVVLYEMLTGTVPFRGESAVAVAMKHVSEPVVPPRALVPDLPEALEQVVLKALAKRPDDRYQSAAALAADLRAAREGGPLAAASFDADTERTRVLAGAGVGETAVMPRVPPRGRRRRRGPYLLLVLLLVVVAAAAAVWWVLMGGTATVPAVVGQSKAAAVRTLEQAGFAVEVKEEYSDRFAAGFVTRQSPQAGTELREGGTVTIWVSRGSTTVVLPDFSGWTAAQVADWLAQNDLRGEQRRGRSDTVPAGRVYRQDPPAGSEVRRGASVTYWVSAGKPQVAVPDLVGLDQAQAQAALAAVGLFLGEVTSEPSETVPAGIVLRQDPAAGTKVAKGARVDIVISSGSPSPSPSPTASTVTLPDVYGMDATVAIDQLEALGLTVTVRKVGGTGQPPGTVVGMSPEPGTAVPVGSRVRLVVAK